MKSKTIVAAICIVGISACSEPAPPEETAVTFNVDTARITVSGVSSGAYMAGQYHVAHSSEVAGAGLLAGGPYWCARGSMEQALGPCMQGGNMGTQDLVDYARTQANLGSIDALEYLNGDRVWVFHGANDTVIHPDVPAAAIEFYAGAANEIDVTKVTDVAAPHGMPTIVGDGACDEVATPFLNNCDYDAAGELLRSISNIDNPRAAQPAGELIGIPQIGAADADMLNEALLYVPADCAKGLSCGLHIAFHGCQQSTEFVQESFATNAGYNEWADNNRLLVLYPQVASSKLAPINPLGCWDWWGYTDESYATREGAQIAVVKALVDTLSGNSH